jgi:hypothetical protein
MLTSAILGVLALAQPAADKPAEGGLAPDLSPPVRIEAAGKPIDTEIGHACPFVGDFDGDGKQDLLVGQFGQGLLWIYRNEGTNERPKLAAGQKFKDGAETGRVPTG